MTDKEKFLKQLAAAEERAKTWPEWRLREALGKLYKPKAERESA